MKKARAQQPTAKPLRCECGNLLARLVPAGVEIKCRRCKRQVIILLSTNRAVESPPSNRKA